MVYLLLTCTCLALNEFDIPISIPRLQYPIQAVRLFETDPNRQGIRGKIWFPPMHMLLACRNYSSICGNVPRIDDRCSPFALRIILYGMLNQLVQCMSLEAFYNFEESNVDKNFKIFVDSIFTGWTRKLPVLTVINCQLSTKRKV